MRAVEAAPLRIPMLFHGTRRALLASLAAKGTHQPPLQFDKSRLSARKGRAHGSSGAECLSFGTSAPLLCALAVAKDYK